MGMVRDRKIVVPPKSSIKKSGFPCLNHPFWGFTPIFGNTLIWTWLTLDRHFIHGLLSAVRKATSNSSAFVRHLGMKNKWFERTIGKTRGRRKARFCLYLFVIWLHLSLEIHNIPTRYPFFPEVYFQVQFVSFGEGRSLTAICFFCLCKRRLGLPLISLSIHSLRLLQQKTSGFITHIIHDTRCIYPQHWLFNGQCR